MKRFLLVILAGCFGGCSLLVDGPKSFAYMDTDETDTTDLDGTDESDWSTVTETTEAASETQTAATDLATESETASTATADPTDTGTGSGSDTWQDTGSIDTGSASTVDTTPATATEPTSDTGSPSDTGGTASDTECVPTQENPTNSVDDDCDSLIDEATDSDTTTPIGDPCPFPYVCMQVYQCGWVFEHPVTYGDYSCPNPQDFCCGEKYV